MNPTIPLCFFCQKHKNEVILLGYLHNDREAPRGMTFDHEPCDTCKGYMGMGIILISVDEEKTGEDRDNPYRTGGWCVVREEYVRRIINVERLLADILNKRFAFVPDDVWDKLGLPRGDAEGEERSDAEDCH